MERSSLNEMHFCLWTEHVPCRGLNPRPLHLQSSTSWNHSTTTPLIAKVNNFSFSLPHSLSLSPSLSLSLSVAIPELTNIPNKFGSSRFGYAASRMRVFESGQQSHGDFSLSPATYLWKWRESKRTLLDWAPGEPGGNHPVGRGMSRVLSSWSALVLHEVVDFSTHMNRERAVLSDMLTLLTCCGLQSNEEHWGNFPILIILHETHSKYDWNVMVHSKYDAYYSPWNS